MEDKVLQLFVSIGKPLKTAEIAEKLNIDKKEVDKIIKKLKAEDKIFSPKVCFYDIKK